MSIRFTHPLALLLLLGLAPIWLWSKRLGSMASMRRRIAIALRVAGYTLCMLALAGMEFTRTSDDLTVFFKSPHRFNNPLLCRLDIREPHRTHKFHLLFDHNGHSL